MVYEAITKPPKAYEGLHPSTIAYEDVNNLPKAYEECGIYIYGVWRNLTHTQSVWVCVILITKAYEGFLPFYKAYEWTYHHSKRMIHLLSWKEAYEGVHHHYGVWNDILKAYVMILISLIIFYLFFLLQMTYITTYKCMSCFEFKYFFTDDIHLAFNYFIYIFSINNIKFKTMTIRSINQNIIIRNTT